MAKLLSANCSIGALAPEQDSLSDQGAFFVRMFNHRTQLCPGSIQDRAPGPISMQAFRLDSAPASPCLAAFRYQKMAMS